MTKTASWMFGALAIATSAAFACYARAQGLIDYNKNDTAILNFKAATPGGESSVGGARIKSLGLPVLDFKQPPVAGAAGFESGVTPRRGLAIYDPKSQYTYSIRHVYDGVIILVSADLRISQDVAGASPVSDQDIVIEPTPPDEKLDLLARAVVYRFGIPYTIDIECKPNRAQICKSEAEIRKIIGKLQLVSVPKEN